MLTPHWKLSSVHNNYYFFSTLYVSLSIKCSIAISVPHKQIVCIYFFIYVEKQRYTKMFLIHATRYLFFTHLVNIAYASAIHTISMAYIIQVNYAISTLLIVKSLTITANHYCFWTFCIDLPKYNTEFQPNISVQSHKVNGTAVSRAASRSRHI